MPAEQANRAPRPSDSENENGLEVKSLVKRFGAFTAVDNVSFNVRRGELVSLLGPSGCGKTTILRMLGGLEYPDSGGIVVSGRNIEHLAAYERNIGFVFQRYALFPHMTVAANIAYPLKKRGVSRQERLEKVSAALELVGLSNFADRNPSTLSGGQQQRVALARAIVFEPEVLLLDEPLGALDKQLRDRMQFELRRIQRSLGITTIFVTHDQLEAMAISDRIAVMQNGKIEQFGTAIELYESPATEFVAAFIGDSNLFDCEVQNTADDVSIATLANGASLRVGKTHLTGSAKLLLRPERIHISVTDTDSLSDAFVNGRVLEVVYLGDSIQYQIDVSGITFTVRALNNETKLRVAPGQQVRLDWKSADAVIVAKANS